MLRSYKHFAKLSPSPQWSISALVPDNIAGFWCATQHQYHLFSIHPSPLKNTLCIFELHEACQCQCCRCLYCCVRLLLDVGIYVDNNGKRSRPLELMWPAPPTAASESACISISTCQLTLPLPCKSRQSVTVVKQYDDWYIGVGCAIWCHEEDTGSFLLLRYQCNSALIKCTNFIYDSCEAVDRVFVSELTDKIL